MKTYSKESRKTFSIKSNPKIFGLSSDKTLDNVLKEPGLLFLEKPER